MVRNILWSSAFHLEGFVDLRIHRLLSAFVDVRLRVERISQGITFELHLAEAVPEHLLSGYRLADMK